MGRCKKAEAVNAQARPQLLHILLNNAYQDPPCTLNWGYMVPNSRYLGLIEGRRRVQVLWFICSSRVMRSARLSGNSKCELLSGPFLGAWDEGLSSTYSPKVCKIMLFAFGAIIVPTLGVQVAFASS